MAAHHTDATESDPYETNTVGPESLYALGTPATHRLAAMGSSVADVIRSAGGWLCDRAMSGWEVTVLMAGDPDDRPLRILGATLLDLESALTATVQEPLPHTLVVAADLCRHDARVRDVVVKTIERNLTEVVVWGENWPVEFNVRMRVAEYHLSRAARSFKAHALTAAGLPCDVVDPAEVFRNSDLPVCRPGALDLMPVG